MIALLSPAKSLELDAPLATRKSSQPRLLARAEALVPLLRERSADELQQLMGISPALAQVNAQRFQDLSTPFTTRNARPAALMFAGDVYRGMAARERFGERDWTEAQKTLRILSGLYGLLRPLDLVQPYRLEMGTRLANPRGDTLYDYWAEAVTDLVNEDLAGSPGPEVVVNLASQEYARAVQPDRLHGTLVSPRFMDVSAAGRTQVVALFAKRARGEMAAWLVLNRVRSSRALRTFDGAGYRYDAGRSTGERPTFVRPPG